MIKKKYVHHHCNVISSRSQIFEFLILMKTAGWCRFDLTVVICSIKVLAGGISSAMAFRMSSLHSALHHHYYCRCTNVLTHKYDNTPSGVISNGRYLGYTFLQYNNTSLIKG